MTKKKAIVQGNRTTSSTSGESQLGPLGGGEETNRGGPCGQIREQKYVPDGRARGGRRRGGGGQRGDLKKKMGRNKEQGKREKKKS